jgi:hypothetical protein
VPLKLWRTVTSTRKSVCNIRHADVVDFEIGAAVALTREHPLVSGGETSVVTNAFQRPQDMGAQVQLEA